MNEVTTKPVEIKKLTYYEVVYTPRGLPSDHPRKRRFATEQEAASYDGFPFNGWRKVYGVERTETRTLVRQW